MAGKAIVQEIGKGETPERIPGDVRVELENIARKVEYVADTISHVLEEGALLTDGAKFGAYLILRDVVAQLESISAEAPCAAR